MANITTEMVNFKEAAGAAVTALSTGPQNIAIRRPEYILVGKILSNRTNSCRDKLYH